MKALTVCQPWAYTIIHGTRDGRVKRVENRDWPTDYRGRLAIHAGRSRKWLTAYENAWLRSVLPSPEELVFGAVVGLVDVVDCVRVEDWRARHGDDPFASGPWCHVYANPRPLDRPVASRGYPGLWDWEPT